MNYLLNRNDFEIIKTLSGDLFFYTPNSQLFSVSNGVLEDYLSVCKGLKKETEFLGSDQKKKIFCFLKNHIEQSLKPTLTSKPDENHNNLLILPISGKCNLRCSYCFATIEGGFKFNDMKPSDARKIIDFLFRDLKSDCVDILFFGGEPLLKFDTMEYVINYISEKYNDKKVEYSLTTNGTLLNDRILQLIKNNRISVLVSIDGPEEISVHRKNKKGEKCFQKTIDTIREFRMNGIHLGLRATITNNSLRLSETFGFFEDLQIPFKIVFAHDSENKNHDLANFSRYLKDLDEEFKKLLVYYLDFIHNNGEINCLSIKEKLKFILLRTKNLYGCSGGRSIFSITSDGTIFSCEHLAGIAKYSVGNINTGIDKKKLSDLQAINVDYIEECKECWLRYTCSGGCFADNISATGYPFLHNKDKCELTKLEFKFFLSLYYEIQQRFPFFFHQVNDVLKNKIGHC